MRYKASNKAKAGSAMSGVSVLSHDSCFLLKVVEKVEENVPCATVDLSTVLESSSVNHRGACASMKTFIVACW